MQYPSKTFGVDNPPAGLSPQVIPNLAQAATNPDIRNIVSPLLQKLMNPVGDFAKFAGHLGSTALQENALQNQMRQNTPGLQFGESPPLTPFQQRGDWFRENPPLTGENPFGLERGQNPFPNPYPYSP